VVLVAAGSEPLTHQAEQEPQVRDSLVVPPQVQVTPRAVAAAQVRWVTPAVSVTAATEFLRLSRVRQFLVVVAAAAALLVVRTDPAALVVVVRA
jgi:hypothetical protein